MFGIYGSPILETCGLYNFESPHMTIIRKKIITIPLFSQKSRPNGDSDT